MRKRTRLVGFIFCLLLVLPVTSRAAGSAGPSYRALVIGNEEYPNHSRLEGAGNDAKKIVGFREPHYSKKIDINADDFENTIIYEQYNLKR